MNERFAQYRERAKLFWSQTGKKQKIWLGASISGLLLAIILLTIVFTRTEYELAFKNLDATDAAAVMGHLDASGIPYELSLDGTSISVPKKDVSRVQVAIGSQGLVQNGSIGFEAFASSGKLGTTENEFNVMYQHRLNGEVQKLLNSLQGVENSRVFINTAEESVFLTPADASKASAAIVMNFTPGFTPSQKDIDSYYNLVKATVSDLEIKDISISSSRGGEMLPTESGGIAGGSDIVEQQFLIQRKYESDLKKEIQLFLSPIVGSDNLVVSVSSSMNFDKKLTHESLVRPLDNNNNYGIVLSEELTNSSSTGSSGQAGGIVGTGETDIPGYTAGSQGESSSEASSEIRNFEFDRINNSIESAPFVVKDLSISIGVEAARLNDDVIRGEIEDFLVGKVRSQLANSGQNVNDDDLVAKKVSIIASTFAENPSSMTTSGLSTPWAIGLGAAALALIGGLAVVLMRRRKAPLQEELDAPMPSSKVEYPTLDLESVSNDSQARKNLESLAKRKPDEFVNLLRTWLVDE